MKKIFRTILLMIISANVFAQQIDFAMPGPKGIIVSLGQKIPNGVKINSVTVERKEEKGSFAKIAEIKCAANETDFLAKVNDAQKYFPDTKLPDEKKLKEVWSRAVKYGISDSLFFYGRYAAVRIALGTFYYDLTAKEKVKYQYKITTNGNSTAEEYTSSLVSFPVHPKFDEAHLETYQLNKEGMYLRFRSVGKNPPAEYKIFRYSDSKTPQEMNGTHADYTVKDTTFYMLQDKNITVGKVYQYSIVGVDKFGNTAIGSQLAVVTAANFEILYFSKTSAAKMPGRLGIKLNWKISDTRDVKSVHIFRSKDAVRGFEEISSVRATDTTYADDKISPDKMFYYYLEARDETGKQSKKSGTFFEYGLETQKPLTPSVISASENIAGVLLRCSTPDKNLAGYRIYRADASKNKFECITDLIPTKDSAFISFLDSSKSLNGKTIYNYYLQTENTSHIQSDTSNKMQCRAGLPTEPTAPPSFSAYYQDAAVNLFWTDLMKDDFTVGGYFIFRKEKSAKDFQQLTDTVFEGNHFTDTKLEDGKTYEYEIQTVDRFGEKSKNKAYGKVDVPANKPIAPGGLRAINTKDGVVLEWQGTAETNVKNIKVYRYQRTKTPVMLFSADIKTKTFTDKTAKPGELYFYYLTSVDDKFRESTSGDEVGVRK